MADNYLERRMDDYRAGKLKAVRRPAARPTADRGSLPELEGTRVLILSPSASASQRVSSLVRLLISAGCKVAFTDSDSRAGNQLAQATGSQCHPIDHNDQAAVEASLALIERRWGGIDFTINA